MGRLKGWTRLARVYALVEQMRSAELRVAAGAVDEVERAVEVESYLRAVQGVRGRAALAIGDRLEWTITETTREYAEATIVRLGEMRVEREDALEVAVAAHRESRVKMEQMKSVVERAGLAHIEDETRRTQAAADDRYAGQAWMRHKGRGAVG